MNHIYHKSNIFIAMLFFSILIFLSGCQKDKGVVEKEEILVRVDNEKITLKDLDFTLVKILGPDKAFQANEIVRKKILESLILSKAIAQDAQKSISKSDMSHLKRQVNDYQEQLLVKHYLRKNVTPQPVTQKMVEDYYENNKERFGGGVIRNYELISSGNRLKGTERKKVLTAFNQASNNNNWEGFAKRLSKKGISIDYKSGVTSEKLLHTTLQNILQSLQVKQISKPFFIDGKAYIVRITHEQKKNAKAFNEVSAEIRKALVPLQLKKAISSVSDEILKTTKIEYSK